MLSFSCTRIGEQDLLLPYRATSSFTTVAGQGWLAGPKPSLDAPQYLAGVSLIEQVSANPIRGQTSIAISDQQWPVQAVYTRRKRCNYQVALGRSLANEPTSPPM